MMSQVQIGTSGWSYPHWKGPFYPAKLKNAEQLAFYASHFGTVEINNSFYRTPTVEILADWRETVAPGFIFSVKANRYITHRKKLREPEKGALPFLDRLNALGAQRGPVLFQLPPGWACNVERLDGFLASLPRAARYTFEFRDPSWFSDDVYAVLERHGAAFCIYELGEVLSPRRATADFIYVRLHGPAGAYQGKYDRKTLADWAACIDAWRAEGRDVYCYFDNDQAGYAVADALELRSLVTSG